MNTKSFQFFTQILEYVIKYFKWVVLFAVMLIVLSGIYRVESNEVAIVLRFGRLVGDTREEQIRQPGLHFALPFFVDEVVHVPVQTVHEWLVATHYRMPREASPLEGTAMVRRGEGTGARDLHARESETGYLITGDSNIVMIMASVRYRIDDPVLFALCTNTDDMMQLRALDGIISGELTRAVTTMDIDYVLTAGRAELGATIMRNSQSILNELRTGITLISIEITDISPPPPTHSYFEEVRSAAVERETSIQQAREESAGIISSAQAEASSYRQVAITSQAERLTRVHGVMAEFDGVYDQFVQNPDLIMHGTFRQRVGSIVAQSGGSIIVPEGGEAPTLVLPSGR